MTVARVDDGRDRGRNWNPKIAGNQVRDARHIASLEDRGWSVLTIWDCNAT